MGLCPPRSSLTQFAGLDKLAAFGLAAAAWRRALDGQPVPCKTACVPLPGLDLHGERLDRPSKVGYNARRSLEESIDGNAGNYCERDN